MKKFVFIMLAILSMLGLSGNVEAQMVRKFSVKEGDVAPNFSITMPDGTTKQLSDLKGKVVMLQFTASWCGVCIEEMPHIQKDIWLKYKDNKNFVLWGIMYKQGEKEATILREKTKITYPLVYDLNGSAFDAYTEKGAGVTRNIIIDKDGKIVCLTRGFDTVEFEKMKEVLKRIL